MAVQHRLIDSVEVTEEKIHIIHLKSVFDASTADEFEQVLRYLMANNYYRFVIDLTKIEFVSSAGWGNFVGELQKIRDNKGDLKLTGMSKEVYDVFLLLELDLFIKAYARIDEALSDFSKNIIGVEERPMSQPQIFERESGSSVSKKETTSRLPARQKEDTPIQPLFALDKDLDEQFEKGVGNIGNPWFDGEGEVELSLDTDLGIDKISFQREQSAKQNIAETEVDASDEISIHRQASPAAESKNVMHSPEGEGSRIHNRPAEEARNFDDTKEVDLQESEGHPGYKNGKLAEQKKDSAFDEHFEYLNKSKIRPTDLNSDPLLEKIISVVIANPVYGPSAIRQMLIRLSMADESLTRSLIYRKLQDVDLSTRAKRIAFARANSL